MAITEKTSPTAAVACVEIRPTKNVSAELYNPVTSILRMVGTASLQTSCGTGVCVRYSYLLTFFFISVHFPFPFSFYARIIAQKKASQRLSLRMIAW
jgi:hypothetical protein